MKKIAILITAVFFTAHFNYSFGKNTNDSLTKDKPSYITTLVINANVTVVLIDNDNAILEAIGCNSFKKLVILQKSGDTLMISSGRKRDFYEGTIYVPASQLRKVHINSKAHVRSLFALQIPKLDVIINSACEFTVTNIGDVNVIAAEDYSFEQSTVVRRLPASFLLKK
jgi:hypothetical protein